MEAKEKLKLWDVVTAYSTGGRDSVVVCIPHKLRREQPVKIGQQFAVKTDEAGRIILEPLSTLSGQNQRERPDAIPKRKRGDS